MRAGEGGSFCRYHRRKVRTTSISEYAERFCCGPQDASRNVSAADGTDTCLHVPCCSDKVAGDCLKSNNWNVEAALDYFYSSGLSATVTGVDTRQVDAMFNKYKGTQ